MARKSKKSSKKKDIVIIDTCDFKDVKSDVCGTVIVTPEEIKEKAIYRDSVIGKLRAARRAKQK